MSTGTRMAEDPSGPRLTAELVKINSNISELLSSQKLLKDKVDEIHSSIFIKNNSNLGIIGWLLKHDNQLSGIIERRKTLAAGTRVKNFLKRKLKWI